MTSQNNFIILLIDNSKEIKYLLMENGYKIISFDDKEKAKDYFYNSGMYIDLILDFSTNEIKTDFEQDTISSIDEDNIIDQINHFMNTIVKEIDFDENLALSMLDHNERIYYKILKRYYDEYYNLEIIIKKLLEDLDFNNIRNYVHKIKGISLNLGSDKLFKITSFLEYKITVNEATEEDVNMFVNYNNRILKYTKEKVENVS